MNPQTLPEAKKLFSAVKKGLRNIKKAKVVICPPFLYLKELSSPAKRGNLVPLGMGAQNCFWEQKGAFSGEISPFMLKNIGCQYVLIGHSERRRCFEESEEMVNKKLKAAFEAKITPILCVGETQEQRDRGETEGVLRKQITGALQDISKFNPAKCGTKLIIAYEPVWAIGTGNPCDFDEAQRMALLIRKIISRIYNQSFAKKIRLLYGGSVTSQNASGYLKEAGFQGLLVGGASLRAEEFIDLVKKTC